MPGPVLIVNPNSREEVSTAIRQQLADWTGAPFEVVTMPQNPAFISTQAEIDACGLEVEALVRARPDARAVIIACYAQPGLAALRATETRPVIGIQDAAVAAALGLAGGFGVIALAQGAIARHARHLETLGLSRWCRGEVALRSPLPPDAQLLEALCDCAGALKRQGARTIVLGCAGLGAWAAPLAARSGLPVIDPVRAALWSLGAASHG